ncbi:hypothetical protein EB796_020545 [Bugula neritina]|uniref:Uncharacterized protein n=1 Tax=Bugula neritina TaxID=10212 RepID=A0A7J7J4X4_BUGNE|nr:hypothetical protein EB796_020545 [Bugula neritina]
MALSILIERLCRKHFTKLVLALIVIYLLSAVHFFSSVSNDKESKTVEPSKIDSLQKLKQLSTKTTRAFPKPHIEKSTPKIKIPIYQPIDISEEHKRKEVKSTERGLCSTTPR